MPRRPARPTNQDTHRSSAVLFAPILRALGQLDDPAILRILFRSLLLSALSFVALVALAVWGVHAELSRYVGWSWAAGALGGVLGIAAALWLFLPLAILIASLFNEPICRAVERRWYPDLPPAHPAHWADQLTEAILASLLVLCLSLLALILSAIPVAGHALGWAITAWALARGLFGGVALRRMSRRQALAAWRAGRLMIVLQGAALVLLGIIPFANLLLPVIGPATMVHAVLRVTRGHETETWG